MTFSSRSICQNQAILLLYTYIRIIYLKKTLFLSIATELCNEILFVKTVLFQHLNPTKLNSEKSAGQYKVLNLVVFECLSFDISVLLTLISAANIIL